MSDHDPLCFCDEFGVCICKELQRRDARVRADEQTFWARQMGREMARSNAVLADLRAKVEGLPFPALRYFEGKDYLEREAVLALLDGGGSILLCQ